MAEGRGDATGSGGCQVSASPGGSPIGVGSAPEASAPSVGQRLGAALADRRDPFVLDAALTGELMTARARVALVLMLLIIQLIPGADVSERIVGLAFSGLAMTLALAIYAVAVRRPHVWFGFASTGVDVSLASLLLVTILLFGHPLAAVNSLVGFELYFLAIGCASLRYDWRICVFAGLLAIAQYGGIVMLAARGGALVHQGAPAFAENAFEWHVVGARLVLLATATMLSAFSVVRAQRLHRLSATDRLTGTANRSAFEQQLLEEARRARRYRRSFSVAVIDLDHFKRVNDTHGHAVGDLVLREVAQTIRRTLRESDMVARYGGEEFALVMPEATADVVQARLEAVREAVAATRVGLDRGGGAIGVTISIGVASWPDEGATVNDVVGLADRRLYEAKRRGRNCVAGPPSSAQPGVSDATRAASLA